MMIPLQCFLSHLYKSKRRHHFAKESKKFQDCSFQKKNAKGLDDLQNLSMVFSWNIIDFMELSFLLDIATSIGVLCHWFLIVSNAPFCKRILVKLNFSSSLSQIWRTENLCQESKNSHWHQMKSAIQRFRVLYQIRHDAVVFQTQNSSVQDL